jgi:hypothetical protein
MLWPVKGGGFDYSEPVTELYKSEIYEIFLLHSWNVIIL